MNRPALRGLARSGVLWVAVVTAAFTTYLNVKPNSELRQLRQGADEREKESGPVELGPLGYDSIEGARVPNATVSDAFGRGVEFSKLLQLANHSIVILEPLFACSSCLEDALGLWENEAPLHPGGRNLEILVVSATNNRQALRLMRQLNLDQSYYSDLRGEICNGLQIPLTTTVALLVDRQRRVIYAQPLSSKGPDHFRSFLQKVRRYVQSEG